MTVPENGNPAKAELCIAYTTRDGNSMKNWAPADFQLENLPIKVLGGHLVHAAGNNLIVDISEPKKFALSVKGFNPHRHLNVDVSELNDSDSDDINVEEDAQ
jgi:hypothetical protein